MCSVMAGLAALGGYAQYRQQRQEADAQTNMYNAQAQVAEQNAKVEARKQEQIADNYAQESNRLRARQRLSEGAQRAQTGAAGLDFSGSSMDILSSGLDAYNQDQNTLLSNQRNDNYSSRVAESNYLNQANADRTAAANISSNSKWSGLGTILGTAASIYGIEQPWKKNNTQQLDNSNYVFGNDVPETKLNFGYTMMNPKMGLRHNPYGDINKNKYGYANGIGWQ